LDSPLPGARITGELSVHGWVTVTGGRLGKIEAILNGHSLGLLDLLQERPDVQLSLPETGRFSGFSGSFPVPRDQRQATAELEIRVTLMDGRELPLARLDLDVSPEQEEGPPRVLVWARGLEAGGSQLRMVEVVAQLCRIGAEVVVASPVEGDLRVALETCGARVEVVPAIPFGSILEYDSAVIDAASWAKPFAFDIVYSPTVTGFPAVEIAALIGARSWLRIGEYEPVSTVATWLHLPFVAEVELRARAAVKLADVVQTRDHATAARYRGMGWEGNFQIHREGTQIDLAPVAPGPIRESLGLSTADRLVLCAGTLWPVKGQAALLEAMIGLGDTAPGLHIACVGFDVHGYGDELRRGIAEHGLADRFWILPFTSDLSKLYAAADVLASTSVSESLSASILEAMAHGLPVIGSAVGGTPELVITGRTGWLYPPNDLTALRGVLAEVSAMSPAQLRKRGGRARKLVARGHDRSQVLPALAQRILELASVDQLSARR